MAVRRTYPLPPGATLLELIGAGTVFDVALVEFEGRRRVCKRVRSRLLAERIGQRAIERETQALRLVCHPAMPRLVVADQDEYGPYIIESL